MSTYLPKEVQTDLLAARMSEARRTSHFRVTMGDEGYRVLRIWEGGFAVEADAPRLRGFVDLHHRGTHLFQCLIVAAAEEDGELHYEFKRSTAVHTTPPVDFVLPSFPRAGLLTA